MRHLSERAKSFISSYYIGSGNKVSVFSKRINPPFEKVKEIYGEELERVNKSVFHESAQKVSLSLKQKAAFRKRLRRENQIHFIKQISSLIIATIITVGIFYGFMALLNILEDIFKYEQIF